MRGEQHGGLRVLHTSLVAPSSSSPEEELSIPLTYLDAIWLSSPPVERVLFYRRRDGDDADEIISNLRRSLSHALGAFFPLAGLLRPAPHTPNRYELHYNKKQGAGVSFTVAEYDDDGGFGFGLDLDDAGGRRELSKMRPLVPTLPEDGAVLALQATLLTTTGMIALGVTVHHAACDGAASTRFLHTWAAAAAGCNNNNNNNQYAQGPPPPLLDRSIIRERKDIHDLFTSLDASSNLFTQQESSSGSSTSSSTLLVMASFTLSKAQLQSIKDKVAREAERRGVPPPRCTSTVAAFGFVWQGHCRVTQQGQGDEEDRARAYFYFSIDHRPRLDPPVPETYLGNCVGPCFASAPRKEIKADLFTACASVAAAIDEAVRGEPDYWAATRWMERLMEAYSGGAQQPLSVAGSPRFRVYDLDFGFGRPAKVDIVSVARTGAFSVAESPSAPGGGIEVGICLPPDAMDRFATCFADGIACLSSSLSSPPPPDHHTSSVA